MDNIPAVVSLARLFLVGLRYIVCSLMSGVKPMNRQKVSAQSTRENKSCRKTSRQLQTLVGELANGRCMRTTKNQGHPLLENIYKQGGSKMGMPAQACLRNRT